MGTLSELVSGAKGRAGMEKADTVSQEEWEKWTQEAHEALYEKLVTAWGSEHFARQRTITFTAGTEEYPAPSDLYTLLHVDYRDSSTGRRIPMKKWELQHEHRYINQDYYSSRPGYRLIEYTFHVRGNIQTGNQMVFWYVPLAPELAVAGDFYKKLQGWDEWIEIHVAQKALVKEGSTEEAMTLGADKGEVERRIDRMAGTKDTEPYEIVDDQGASEYYEYYHDWVY